MPENPAPVSARILAFTLDVALAVAGCAASLKAFFPHVALSGNPHVRLFALLWTALFILFHGYMSCEGRRSPGKAALGLRVVDAEGEPLGAGKAYLRSAAYILSSIGNLGFVWVLVGSSRRCWHDLIAGSRVVEDAPGTRSRLLLLRAGATLCVAGFIGLWYYRVVVVPRYNRILWVSAAELSLDEMKHLERIYFYGHGEYTVDLENLAKLSKSPADFRRDETALLDETYGVHISTSRTMYRISARARNDVGTLVSIEGP